MASPLTPSRCLPFVYKKFTQLPVAFVLMVTQIAQEVSEFTSGSCVWQAMVWSTIVWSDLSYGLQVKDLEYISPTFPFILLGYRFLLPRAGAAVG